MSRVVVVAAIVKVVWSRRQPLANTGAERSVLDGPSGCDPANCMVWFGFRMLRRYLMRLLGFFVCWTAQLRGCPGHGPVHLLVDSATKI